MGDQPTSEKWLPSNWMDEMIPAPQQDPSAFIRGPIGDLWLIAPVEDEDVTDEDEFWRMKLAPGDVIQFDLCRIWPSIEVTIGNDGKIEKHDPIPDGATLFWYGCDSDTINYSLEELVSNVDFERPDTIEVDCYDWSISASFRLVVDAAGARFEKVEEASA